MNWHNFNILLSDTYIVKNTNLLLHTLSMDGKEKGHDNSLPLKEPDDKQENQMERPDDSNSSIRDEGDKDKEEVLNLQQQNIGVHGGQQAAAMNSSSEEDDDKKEKGVCELE